MIHTSKINVLALIVIVAQVTITLITIYTQDRTINVYKTAFESCVQRSHGQIPVSLRWALDENGNLSVKGE